MKGFAVTKNRIDKARKIETILKDYTGRSIKNLRILEIGCGSGIISNYFGEKNSVYSVDIEEPPIKKRNFRFSKVKSEKLPFKNDYFDIVISNHVIEHVPNQEFHLSEVKRVMKNNGVGYLATPNKIFPIEPHYKVPFIHYLSNKLFYSILRFLKKYNEKIFLLSYFSLIRKLKVKFIIKDYTPFVIKNKFIAKKSSFNILSSLPLRWINKLAFLSPTVIFILSKNEKRN